jgi:hypothetical protein
MLVYDWDYLGNFKYTSKLDPVILPSGKHTKHYGKSQFLMGKSTISTGTFSIAMFVYQRVTLLRFFFHPQCLVVGPLELKAKPLSHLAASFAARSKAG